MKLKELSKLPKITAPKSFVEKAGKDTPRMIKKYGSTEYRYETREYAKCRIYGDIIKVALFYTKNLRLGATMPAYEIFIDYKNDDFVTYDYSANRWSNATIEKLDTSFYWWSEAKEKKYMSVKDRAFLKINLKIEEDDCDYRFSGGEPAKALHIDKYRMKRLVKSNGGLIYLEWLKNEKEKNTVYDDTTIQWLEQQNIRPEDIEFISDRMSVQQIKNYICRQMSENSMTSIGVIQTWSDYLGMAERLKMNTSDPIVYRAKKLRQRHDELVKEVDDKERALRAVEISKKYPNIETVLQKIKPKYEYEDETYSILIPGKIEDILAEGAALHHCIDKTDRYFDRINAQESYLMFLRRTAEKDKPYYTLEVEPNGTVRQKRTEFDRQNPDIEDAKTFLRKWQKIISKRLSSEDMKLASKSKKLRNEEFEELERTKAQIRNGALQGHLLVTVLREDLMENTDESEKVSV